MGGTAQDDPGAREACPEGEVERLVFECLERSAAGEADAVEAVCAAHPELATRIRRALDTLDPLSTVEVSLDEAPVDMPERLGDYRLVRELGRGGMGVVYLAEQESLGRRVALKLVRPELLYFPGSRERFLREASAVARLQHPGIVPIHTVGEEQGVPYFAMELVRGCSLSDAVKTLSELPPEELTGRDLERVLRDHSVGLDADDAPPGDEDAPLFDGPWITTCLRLVRKVAAALDHVHARGVLHRDVKPSNLLVTPGGSVMLTDFGLAWTEGVSRLTQSCSQVGSLPYMSPEQVRGDVGTLAPSTDTYSLGVLLFECLTLRAPFMGPTPARLQAAIQEQPPPDVRRLNPRVSDDLRAVLETALEKDPDRRYRTAAAFAEDLTALLEGRPVSVKPVSWPGRVRRWARRRPVTAALVVVLGCSTLIVAALGGFLVAKLPEIREVARMTELRRREDALQAAVLAQGEAQPERAAHRLEVLLADAPECREALAHLAVLHAARRPATALELLDAHAELVASSPGLRHIRADVLTRLGREAGAPRAPAGQPATALEWYLLGLRELEHGATGDRAAARRALHAFTRAVLLAPEPRALYFFRRSHAAGLCRDREAALECADALAAHWPESPAAAFWSGYALDEVAPELAEVAYRKAVALKADLYAARSNLASVLADLGRHEEALQELDAIVRERPRYVNAHFNAGIIRRETGDLEGAVASFERMLELREDDHRGHNSLGITLHDLGRRDAALAHVERAIELEPRSPYAHHNLGVILNHAGRHEEALGPLQRSLELRDDDATTHSDLGFAYARLNRLDEALAAFRRATEIDPGHWRAQRNLGTALAAVGRDEEAVAAWRRALELRPGDAAFRRRLAATLAELGRSEEAIDVLRGALEIDGEDPDVLCDLGAELRRMGRFREAFATLSRGHRLGRESAGWSHPTAAILKTCEREARLEEELEGWLADPAGSLGVERLRALAGIAGRKRAFVGAARLWADVLDAKPRAMEPDADRRAAARAALLAGTGQGADAAEIDARGRRGWRRRALAWLQEELAAWDDAVGRGARRERERELTLAAWKRDEALASARSPAMLSSFSPAERKAWQTLWTRVEQH